MRPRQYHSWILAALAGASLSAVVPAARASAALSLTEPVAAMEAPFQAVSYREDRSISTVNYVADPMAPVDYRAVTYDGTGASPGAGNEFYVDWVSPLQSPRGPSASDLTSPGAFTELDPMEAFAVSPDEDPAPLSIPEPRTVALLGASLLPLVSLLRRRH